LLKQLSIPPQESERAEYDEEHCCHWNKHSLLPDMLARLAFTRRDNIACHDAGSAEIMPYSNELYCIAI
jgi:hypothetical protein